jgi:hypothetical protein
MDSIFNNHTSNPQDYRSLDIAQNKTTLTVAGVDVSAVDGVLDESSCQCLNSQW